MQSRFLSNQRRQSCNSKQSLPKINKKVSNFEGEKQTMVVKSLPKQSKSSSLSHSITVAIDNISQLISFLGSAKIQPDKQSSIIDSLKSYLLQLKQHLKTNLIVIKPTNFDKNQLSNLILNVYAKSNDISKIKNLNTQKYRNKILTPIQNCSGLMNEKSISNKIQNKIHKTPYFSKGLFPNLKQIDSKTVNRQHYMTQNLTKSIQHEIKIVQKIQQEQKNDLKSICFKPQLQKKKILRVKRQIQTVKSQIQRDEKNRVKEQQIKKIDPIQIIEKLKFKISSHESLIQKLKNKLNQFENIAPKQNKPIHKNPQNPDKISTNLDQNIKQNSEILKGKENSNEKTHQQKSQYKSQLDVLKAQLKARQQEIISLWTLIQSTQHSSYPLN